MSTISAISRLSINIKTEDKNNIYSDFINASDDIELKNFAQAVNSLQNSPYVKIEKTTYTELI